MREMFLLNKKLIAIIGICVVLVVAIIGIVAINSDKGTAEAPATEADSQVLTEDVQNQEFIETEPETPITIEPVTATQEQLDKIVYSDFVGVVNGITYSVINVGTKLFEGLYNAPADNPVIPRLPVEADGYMTAFAQYGDYVYYVVTESRKWGETFSVYRCKTDFTQSELLVKNEPVYDDGTIEIAYNFIIDNGKLCSFPYETVENDNKYQCIDLETKEITYEDRIDYRGLKGVEAGEGVAIYAGEVFFTNIQSYDSKDKIFAYHLVDGKRVPLIDESIVDKNLGVYICGYVDGYVYYYESFNTPVDGANNLLKKYNLSDGTVELIDKRVIGGDGCFFHEY